MAYGDSKKGTCPKCHTLTCMVEVTNNKWKWIYHDSIPGKLCKNSNVEVKIK